VTEVVTCAIFLKTSHQCLTHYSVAYMGTRDITHNNYIVEVEPVVGTISGTALQTLHKMLL
jgi:hypothetical protein